MAANLSMSSEDQRAASQGGRVSRASREIAASLGDLQDLFADTESTTQHRSVQTLFERIEVLGARETTVPLTDTVASYGFAAAIPDRFDVTVGTGRGERHCPATTGEHRSAHDQRARAGCRVEQGQRVGDVARSGLTTEQLIYTGRAKGWLEVPSPEPVSGPLTRDGSWATMPTSQDGSCVVSAARGRALA